MKKYRKAQPVSVPISLNQKTVSVFTESKACCTVKVENLSKLSSEAGLKEKLVHYDRYIKSIRIVDCKASPANFAYVNCTDLEPAKLLVSTIDRKIILDSNLLTAKLKHGGASLPQARTTHVSGRDVCTVKVLIDCGPQLTEEDLNQHFCKYGELSSPCKIRLGTPNYAYVNFSDPLSAQEARKVTHTVCGVILRTVPASYQKTHPQLNSSPKLKSGHDTEFVRYEFPCDPLAGDYVKVAVNDYVRERSLQAKVTAQQSNICLFSGRGVAAQIREFINSSIRDHESMIRSIEKVMDCCYLPVLSDPSVKEQLAKLQVPFEVKVLLGGRYVPLEKLVQVYSECDEKVVQADDLKPFLQPAKSESSEYRWYWEEGSVLRPYNSLISQKLEQAFVSKLIIVESIGQFEYILDTSRMKQTNIRTNKVRKMERKVARETEKWNVSLRIRAHSDHVQEIEREIMVKLEKCVQEIKVPVVDDGVIEQLLEVARQGFVSAEIAGNTIVLSGMLSVVKNIEVQLKDVILTKKLEEVTVRSGLDGVRVPPNWEPQDHNKCTLKEVRRRTEEWTKVEQHMMERGFHVKVLCVERIQNPWLWDVYDRSRTRMSGKNRGQVNEKYLFHGTRTVPPVKIYNSEQGFDNRLSSRGMWGEGAYFAVKASYSDKYSYTTPEGSKQIFLVKVITGITLKCSSDRSLKAPPKKSDHQSLSGSMFEDERYDSVSGDTGGSEVFIIYEHGKVYPDYLITYKLL